MIFIACGTQLPFNRLSRAMDDWAVAHPRTEVLGQLAELGPQDYRPTAYRWAGHMPPEAFGAAFDRAELVVAHAGMGVILSALTRGKPLIIMPRRADLREHRNDHQLATARHFGDKPGIEAVETPQALFAAIDRRLSEPAAAGATIPEVAPANFTDALRAFIFTGRIPE